MKSKNRLICALVGFVVMFFSGVIYAWSVLSVPIGEEFPEWSQAQLSMAFTLVMIGYCIGGLVCGIVFLKLRPKARYVFIAAAALFAAGCFGSAWSSSLSGLYIFFGICCGLGCGAAYNAAMTTAGKWFADKPGTISGVLLMGMGLGSFLIGKLYQMLTPERIGGWRISFVVIGIIEILVCLAGAFFIKEPKEAELSGTEEAVACGKSEKAGTFTAAGIADAAAENNENAGINSGNRAGDGRDLSPARVFRTPQYWLYFLFAIVSSAAGLVIISQASGMAAEVSSEASAGLIATVVGLISICNGIGRFFAGTMYDKLGRSKTMLSMSFLYIASGALMIIAQLSGSFSLLVAGFIIAGFGYSGVTPTNSAFTTDYFGTKYYSVNLFLVNSNLIIASFGSTLAGAVFDATQSYFVSYIMIIGMAVLGILLSLGISVCDRKKRMTSSN